MNKTKLAMFGTVLAAAAILGAAGAGPAQAQESSAAHSGLAIARTVFASSDPASSYARLSASDRAAFDAVEKPTTEFTDTTILKHQTNTGAWVRTDAAAAPAATGCWDAWVRYGWKAAAGNTVYTAWQGLTWCSRSGTVYGWRVYDRGGETNTPGWSYRGHDGQGIRSVGWEVRSYTKEKFHFGAGPIGFDNSRCVQIRGGQGLYSSRASCTLA